MRKFFTILTILLVAVTTLQIWMTKGTTDQQQKMEQNAGQGEAAIGGAFTLTDQNGAAVSDNDLRGRLMLVFFGFTHCPDICPVTAGSLSKTMGLLGNDADKVVPVFITVDPERDTPPVMKDYFANFDKRIVALTGSPEQIKAVTEAYKAYYAKSGEPQKPADDHHAHGAGHGSHAEHASADYSVDHSGFIYLMNKDGKYIMHFPYNADAQELADAVRKHSG